MTTVRIRRIIIPGPGVPLEVLNRELEEKKIEREMTDEWEKKLQMITAKYEDDLRKKKDKNSERVNFYSNKIFLKKL